ncbi:MAG TPA: hypothetical protein VFI11_05545, partial [Anaerolineales bacterium]|nr:hypothetical protein [Anaerolineales bacterium]
IFAPATLLAVVVLATLYLRDSADSEEGAERIAGGLGRMARGSLLISGPLLAGVGALEAARYLDAERVEAWLDALPGTRYFIQALELAPLALVLAVGVGIMLGYAPGGAPPTPATRPEPVRPWTRARFGRVAAGVVLTLATPALLLSVFGLVYQAIWPERLAELLEPLPGDTYLRLLLMLAPTGLLAVLLLALLYLLGPLDPERTQPMRPQLAGLARRMENRRSAGERRPRSGTAQVEARMPTATLAWRSDLAMIVLVVGMVVAVAAGALLVGGMLVLLVVR